MPDYSYVPPTGDQTHDQAAQTAEDARGNTKVITSPGSLADFLQLIDHTSIFFPANDLRVSAHGDSEGEMFFSVDSNTPPTTYEDLERVNTNKKINIPPHVLKPTTNFRMASCLIGTDTCLPMLKLFKQALGNPKSVSAPRYIDAYMIIGGKDVYHFMEYCFALVSKTLPARADIVKNFKAAGNSSDPAFRFVDGSKVPDQNWDTWVPPASAVSSRSFKLPFPVIIGSSLQILEAEWHIYDDQYVSDPVIFLGSNPPKNEAEALQKLQDVLSGGNLDPNHKFPVYKRHHHDTLTEFIAALVWRANGNNGNFSAVTYVGTQWRYQLEIPVTKPGTMELIYNFYPDGGTPVINFDESNNPYKMYGVV
jgi:hypothetical protein